MAKKNKNKMLLILGAAIVGFFIYKRKKDAENEEFTLPNKTAATKMVTATGTALNLSSLKRSFAKPKTMIVKKGSGRGANLDINGNSPIF